MNGHVSPVGHRPDILMKMLAHLNGLLPHFLAHFYVIKKMIGYHFQCIIGPRLTNHKIKQIIKNNSSNHYIIL